MSDLWLAVKQQYFDQYKAGDKPYEYRLYNEYWRNRLVGRDYGHICYTAGYPSKAQRKDRMVKLPYHGYKIQVITHPHFGDKPVKVFAIKLEKEIS